MALLLILTLLTRSTPRECSAQAAAADVATDTPAVADAPAEPSPHGLADGLDSLLRIVSKADATDAERWAAVRESSFHWKSGSDVPEFEFDAVTYGFFGGDRTKKSLMRLNLAYLDGHSVAAVSDERRINRVLFDRFCMAEDQNGELGTDARWSYTVNADQHSNFKCSSAGPETPGGFIQFHPAAQLSTAMGSDVPKTQWSRGTQTLTLLKPTGSSFHLRFRSPNDAERWCFHRKGAKLNWQGFVCRDTAVRLSSPSKLLECFEAGYSVDHDDKAELMAREKVANQALDRWVNQEQFPLRDLRPKELGNNEIRNRIHEFLIYSAAYATKLLPKELATDTERRQNARKHRTMALQAIYELLTARRVVSQAIVGLDSQAFLDDPILRWRGIELACSAAGAAVGHEAIWTYITQIGLSLELKAELAAALGDVGCPQTWVARKDFSEDDELCAAILHCRWQWECSPRELELCLTTLDASEPDSRLERVMVGSLARMDALGKVPRQRWQRWFQSEIVEAESVMRWENLRALSLVPSGRACLLDVLEHGEPAPAVRAAIADMLRARADATLRTGRFDFMTEDHRHRTLTACER